VSKWWTLFFIENRGLTARVGANYERNVASKMAVIPATGYQSFWANKRSSLKFEDQRLFEQLLAMNTQLKQLFKVLCDIKDVAGHISSSVGESEQWSAILNVAEKNRQNFCKTPLEYPNYFPVWNIQVSLTRVKGQVQGDYHRR
jgi:hypothetical protein